MGLWVPDPGYTLCNGSGKESCHEGNGSSVLSPTASCGGISSLLWAHIRRVPFFPAMLYPSFMQKKKETFSIPLPPAGRTRRNTKALVSTALGATLIHAMPCPCHALSSRTLVAGNTYKKVPKPILRRAKRPRGTTFVPASRASGLLARDYLYSHYPRKRIGTRGIIFARPINNNGLDRHIR